MKNEKIIEAYHTIRPDEESRQRVMETIREKGSRTNNSKPRWIARPAVAAAILVLALAGGVTSYAMWRYLTPSQVADEFENKTLAAAFETENAVSIGEKQYFKDYNVTLLGMLSGSNLSDYLPEINGEIQKEQTYCVLAIENADGSAMKDFSRDEAPKEFLVSPFIQGESPLKVNIFHMNGGAVSCVKNGVLYRIVDCDELSAFADRKVYLAVVEGAMPCDLHVAEKPGEKVAYIYDKKTGEAMRNEAFDGLNALFTLPLSADKADEKRADELLKKWSRETAVSDSVAKKDESEQEDKALKMIRKYIHERYDAKVIQKEFTLIKPAVQTVKPDKDGNFSYHWEAMGTGEESVAANVEKFETFDSNLIVCGFGADDKMITTTLWKLNNDGTVTIMPYYKKI